VAKSQGWQKECWKKKRKILIICSKQILNYCEKLKEIKEVTAIIVKFYNFCNGLPS